MKTTTALRNVMYLCKDCEKSAQFFVDVLGLKINHLSSEYAELLDKKNHKLVFKQTESDAHTRVAYSPILTFAVVSYKLTMEKLETYEGEFEFDGEPIDNEESGKLACIKTWDGIVIGIHESTDEVDEDDFNPEFNPEAKMDSISQEIRGVLDKFKL